MQIDLARLQDAPRQGVHWKALGSYRPVIRFDNEILDPGDDLVGTLMVTGYGAIDGAKLFFRTPRAVFSERDSSWWSGFGQDDDGVFRFGCDEYKGGTTEGITIDLCGGLSTAQWGPTQFVDIGDSRVPQVLTEIMTGDLALVSFTLKTRESTRPGQYVLTAVLTFYDGERWQSTEQQARFTVRSLLQRHEAGVAWIAVVAAVATVLSLGVAVVALFVERAA